MKIKGFTLIELLVTIAVIAILVLLATPHLLGYTDEAKVSELTTNTRAIQDASERYYFAHAEAEWPRLTDTPYTDEEVKAFSERIYDITGEVVDLDPYGNYYDIDFDKLKPYIDVPGEKANYILQNPVGKVYLLYKPTQEALGRLPKTPQNEEMKMYKTSEQIIDAGNQADWVSVEIENSIPEGTSIEYLFSSSENQVEWSSFEKEIKDVPTGRFLKILVNNYRYDSVEEEPKTINISPSFEINNVISSMEITKQNEKINMKEYINIIYVDSVNGLNSNDGTKENPVETLNLAYDLAQNGDLIYLQEGKYTFSKSFLDKKVDMIGKDSKTTLIFNSPYKRFFNVGNGYVGIKETGDTNFYNLIVETRGKETFANYFYNRGHLAFYNVGFKNFFNLDYTNFVHQNGSLYFYNVSIDNSASNNLFVRKQITKDSTLVLQNVYGPIEIDNAYSNIKIDLNILKDSLIVDYSYLDNFFNIQKGEWENKGLGKNPDESQSHIGVYGGPNAWKQ